MEQNFGKLILPLPGGQEQEFELGKASISLGRAMTNDIVLGDARVSRNHARIECGPLGCTLVDLGSSNGTRLNGKKVDKAVLSSGDTLHLGSSSLRYEVAAPSHEPEMTIIDSESDLESTLGQVTLVMSLNETEGPRLLIHSPEKTWEVQLDDADSLVIGRALEHPIVIDHPKVSRNHAQVIRRGQAFVLRDSGSTNGTWMRGQRVDERILQDGDLFSIGNAQIVFKSGFQKEALTMVGDTMLKLPLRRPVVFVPGFMGSELWLGNERVWPNVKHLFKHPELFIYSEDTRIEPRGLLGEVVIVPNLIKLEQYNRLGDYLVEDLGYERGKDFFEFAYDWRQDVRRSAQQLAQAISDWPVKPPITIIAHSMGTIVSRYYVERLGGKDKVERLLLMGGPHQGTPKALTSLVIGPELLPFGILGERLRQLLASFPSSYQILPTYLCTVDQNGQHVQLLEDESWITDEQRPMLRAARQFRKELGTRSSVPAVSIFGYGIKTVSQISVIKDEYGKWKNILYRAEPGGDSTIPEKSAVLAGSEIHPVQQYHGTLYVDNDVKMRLKLELTRPD